MFFIFQLFVVAALTAGVIVYFGKIKGKEKSIIAGLVICLLLSALVANGILNMVPLPTDEVVVSATGEKNEAAKSNEAYILRYLVGGKEYKINNPTAGKWFWKGNYYMWRNESDLRQPEGTTRSITLNIPYGKDRSIQFGLSQWNGIVEVSYHGESQRYDLFLSGNKTTLLASVPDTDSFALYSAKLLRLVLFSMVVFALMAYPVFCAAKYRYEVIKMFWWKHWDKLVYAFIAITCFILMFRNGKTGSLWSDDVWTIGWAYTGWSASYVSNFFQLLYNFWFYCMPYGQEYLLIISELLTAAGIYILGLIGSLYKSKKLGIIMAGLGAASPTILTQCGKEFRPYALLFFSSILVVYFFIKKQKEMPYPRSSTLLLYGAFIVVYMDTHPFGLVCACFMMAFDMYLVVRKKLSRRALLEFVFPAIDGVYWIYWVGAVTGRMGVHRLAAAPTVKGIINDIMWICGHYGANLLFILFILGICVIAVTLIYQVVFQKFDFKDDYIALVNLLVPISLFAVAAIWSKYINPDHSLWTNRYFVSTIVFVEFIIAMAVDYLINIFSECISPSGKTYLNSAILTLAFVVSVCCIHWYGMPYQSAHLANDFRGAAEYIMSQNDVYRPTTLCYVTGDPLISVGFEYYLTHKGERDSIKHIGNPTSEELSKYNTVYGVSYRDNENVYNFMINNGFELAYFNGDTSLSVRKWVRP